MLKVFRRNVTHRGMWCGVLAFASAAPLTAPLNVPLGIPAGDPREQALTCSNPLTAADPGDDAQALLTIAG
jgi:hypothetical protein